MFITHLRKTVPNGATVKTMSRYRWLIAVVIVELIISTWCNVDAQYTGLLERYQPNMDLNPQFLQLNETKLLTCKDIGRIQQLDTMGRGTTKEVFGGKYRDMDVAIKMVTPAVKDVRLCLDRRAYRNKEECYEYANYKLMKEIAYSLQLNNDRFLKLLGYCVRGDAVTGSVRDQGVISVVEVGIKLNDYRLKKLSWPQRLQVGLDTAELLVSLENSPLGSIEIGDFKLSQFLMVDGRLKVGDLDDMSSEERYCQRTRDCSILGENAGIDCVNSTCIGINAKANILLATVELLEPLFQSPPERIKGRIQLILKKLQHYAMNADELQRSLADLTESSMIDS